MTHHETTLHCTVSTLRLVSFRLGQRIQLEKHFNLQIPYRVAIGGFKTEVTDGLVGESSSLPVLGKEISSSQPPSSSKRILRFFRFESRHTFSSALRA